QNTGGRHRCHRADGNRPDRAGAPSRYQENPRNPPDRGRKRRLPHRRRRPRHGDHGSRRPEQGLAGPARRSQAERPDPGAWPAADSVPALIAAGALARIIGPNGTREVPVEQIPTAPGKTSLAKGELIVSFLLPARPAHSGDAYQRFTPRTEMDIAVVGVGVNLTLDANGNCTAARVALGAVAPTVLLVKAAADALIGTPLDEAARGKPAAAA